MTIIPERADFAVVYRALQRLSNPEHISLDVLTHNLGGSITYGKLRVILEAMNELGLIVFYEDMKKCSVRMLDVHSKVRLEDSVIIKNIREVYGIE